MSEITEGKEEEEEEEGGEKELNEVIRSWSGVVAKVQLNGVFFAILLLLLLLLLLLPCLISSSSCCCYYCCCYYYYSCTRFPSCFYSFRLSSSFLFSVFSVSCSSPSSSCSFFLSLFSVPFSFPFFSLLFFSPFRQWICHRGLRRGRGLGLPPRVPASRPLLPPLSRRHPRPPCTRPHPPPFSGPSPPSSSQTRGCSSSWSPTSSGSSPRCSQTTRWISGPSQSCGRRTSLIWDSTGLGPEYGL